MMKRLLVCLLSVAMLFAASAFAEGQIVLPTPQPMEAPAAQDDALQLPTPPSAPAKPLPNPAQELNVNYNPDYGTIDFGDITYLMLCYPSSGSVMSAWLKRCEEWGYQWSFTSTAIAGYDAYAVTDGANTAYMVQDYDGMVLLLLPKGMEMEEGIEELDPYANNKLQLTLNGLKYVLGMTGNQELFGSRTITFGNAKLDITQATIILPSGAKQGDTFSFNKRSYGVSSPVQFYLEGSLADGAFLRHGYSRNPLLYSDVIGSPSDSELHMRFVDDEDYFTVQVIYRDGDVWQCRFEGRFDGGKTTVSGTFKTTY